MEDLHRQVIDLQRKFREYVDDSNSPVARQLNADIQRLEDDVQVKKNPRSIEDLVKRIISQLNAADGSGALNNDHIDDLKDKLEDVRRQLQKLM